MKGKVYEGNVEITKDNQEKWMERLKGVEKITGYVSINSNCELKALKSVGGSVSINSNCELKAERLESVGGSVSINSNCELKALKSVGGSVSINSNAELKALKSVGGSVFINSNCELKALKSVGGSVFINSNCELKAERLESVGSSVSINSNAKANFSKSIKKNDITAQAKCRKHLEKSFEKSGYSFADNILSEIIQKKGNLYKVRICGKTEISYLVTDGEAYSHGATLQEARDGLMFKISSRDTSEFKSWKLSKIISKRDAIRAYRMITGACEQGVRQWMNQQGKTPEKISVKDLIKLTKGAYGNETFEKFFA